MNYLLLTAFIVAYWLAIFWVATVIGRVFAGPRERRVPAPPAAPRARYIATRDNAGVVVFLPDEDDDR